jgi:hypothetical protein
MNKILAFCSFGTLLPNHVGTLPERIHSGGHLTFENKFYTDETSSSTDRIWYQC